MDSDPIEVIDPIQIVLESYQWSYFNLTKKLLLPTLQF